MLATVCEIVMTTGLLVCAPPVPVAEAEWLYRQRSGSYSEAGSLSVGIQLDGEVNEPANPAFIVTERDALWSLATEDNQPAVTYRNLQPAPEYGHEVIMEFLEE